MRSAAVPLASRIAMLLIVVVAVATYANTLGAGFLYDDHTEILENPWLRQGLSAIPTAFAHHFDAYKEGSRPVNFYRPLMHTLNILLYQVAGTNPMAYHLVSVALHAAVSLLLFLTVSRALPLVGGVDARRGLLVPAGAALAFAVHPVHVESVAWVSERTDLLLGVFFLLSLYSYLRLPAASAAPTAFSPVSLGAFVLALFSKETAMVLPLLIVGSDLAIHGEPWRGLGRAGRRYAPYLVVLGVYLAIRIAALGALTPEGSGLSPSPAHQAAAMLQAFGWDLGRLVLPLRYTLCSEIPLSATPLLDPATWLAAAAILVGVGGWTLLARRDRLALWAGLLVLLPLLPTLLAVTALKMPLADRYLYVPSLGFCTILAIAFGRMQARRAGSRLAIAVGCLVLTAWGSIAVVRNTVFRNEERFWSHVLRRLPNMPWPGGWGSASTREPAIEPQTLRAVLDTGRLGYSAVANWEALAAMALDRGRADDAARFVEMILLVEPGNARIRELEGDVRLARGDSAGAIESYLLAAAGTAAVGRPPEVMISPRRLPREAIPLLESRREHDRGDGLILTFLGDARLANGDTHGAILDYLEAVEAGGAARAAFSRLGLAFEQTGDLRSALQAYQSAVTLFPAVEPWHADLERVRALQRSGK